LLAAWIDALTHSERTDPARDRAPTAVWGDPEPGPVATTRSEARAKRARPRSKVLPLLAPLAVSVLVCLVMLPLISWLADQFRPSGSRTLGGVTLPVTVHDDRVVVPGLSAQCLTKLVKPRADGTTNGISGVCFTVG
jgi:hypothetical protein